MVLPKEGKRIDYIDRLKGLLILWVVWYHTNHPQWVGFYCHVPLFMVLSGAFLKTDYPFISHLKKKTNQLFIPFLFFYIFGFAYNLLYSILTHKVDTFLSPRLLYAWMLPEALPFNIPTWFIITLFYISIVAYPLIKWVKNPWIGFSVPMIISYLYNVYFSDVTLPMHGNHVIIWFPFVIFGYYFGQKTFDWIEDKKRCFINGIVCLIVFILIINYETDFAPVGIFVYYLRILLFWGILLMLFRYILPASLFGFLGYFGKNSLILLGVQSLFLNFMIQWVRPYFNLPSNEWVGFTETVYTALLSIPAIYFLNKYLPQFVGRKALWK